MINRLPPHTPYKVHQLATWAVEFKEKPKPILATIALNPSWQTTNLNERAVAFEALVYRKLIEKNDISSLFDFLIDDENFPIVISKDEITENDIPEGVDKRNLDEALEFTRCEFQRTNARLRYRVAEVIAEHILQNDDLELISDFNRAVLEIINNMLGEPYFFPKDDNPNMHLVDFIKVLYLSDTESASQRMSVIGINENNLYLSLDQIRLLQSHNERLIRDYSI